MTPASSPPHLPTLILMTALSTLSLNMFLPSLANIATEFDTSYATVSLSIAGYLAVTAVVQLVVGPLSDRIGRRPVVLGTVGIFVAASIGCTLATDIWTFLGFRMLQAAMVAGHAMSMAIVRDTRTERQAAGTLAFISMSMAVAPMLGPMVGGTLDTLFGWRASFWFYTGSGVALLLLCWIDLGETYPRRDRKPGDAPPGRPVDLLRLAPFWGFALCSMSSVGAFYVFLAGAPLVAAETFGISTATLGLFIGSITMGFVCGTFLSTRLSKRFDITTMMLAGRLAACAGLGTGLVILLSGHLHIATYFGATIFVGLGNGLTVPSAYAGALSVRPDLAGTAAGVNGALIVGAGAGLTLVTGALMEATDAPVTLLSIMFGTSFAGLLATLWSRRMRAALQREIPTD
ncbi:multidrug effflux MFS transporter [Minwuia sp.]|uniref:multidrug effflux MFS transporter n=1 Tax=Minwuia sp. TaxID=2493630 RepID=UPI003A8EDC26